MFDQTGGNIVLGRQRVGGTQGHVGTAGLEGAHQVGGFGGDMQAGRQAHAFQGFLARKNFSDLTQGRHMLVGPLVTLLAFLGQLGVFDIASACTHVPVL